MKTTIQIDNDVWKKINDLRKKSSESYNDVLRRVLKIKKECQVEKSPDAFNSNEMGGKRR